MHEGHRVRSALYEQVEYAHFELENVGDVDVIYHEGISEYDFGPETSLRGDRFPRYIRLLESKGIFSNYNVRLLTPEPANDDDLMLVHTPEYIQKVNKLAEERGFLSDDTPLKPSLLKAIQLIVGAALKAGERVARGEARISQGVGGGLHHAGRNYGDAWCVYNDVAICAQALIERHGMDRVMILDTDAHAGNGTMDIFYDDPKVLYLSIHQDPATIYPGTGFIDQIGSGEGEGFTVNVPLPRKADDHCYRLALEKVFQPLARQFKPQVIIRNGGADPHHLDEIAELNVTYEGLWMIGRTVVKTAADTGCPIVDLLCGGYTPGIEENGLYAIFAGELNLGLDLDDASIKANHKLIEKTNSIIGELGKRLKGYWELD